MNFLPKLRKNQTGQIGTATEATSSTRLGDLTMLSQLIKPMRHRMAEYDHAVHALSVARERLHDLADQPPPDMALTVKREIAVAMNDPEALTRFDAENGEAFKVEREAREAALRDREELPARILALEQIVRQIAKRMIDEEVVGDIEREAQQAFAPYAQRLMVAAQRFADVMQEANTAASALKQCLMIYEYDLFADLKRIHRPDLMGEVDEGILPKTMATVSWEAIQEINRQIGRIKPDVEQQMNQELAAADLLGERLRLYYPCAENDHRKISSPELTRRVKRPPQVLSAVATRVVIGT